MGETALALGIASIAACAGGRIHTGLALSMAGTAVGLIRLVIEPDDTVAREGLVSSAVMVVAAGAYLAGAAGIYG